MSIPHDPVNSLLLFFRRELDKAIKKQPELKSPLSDPVHVRAIAESAARHALGHLRWTYALGPHLSVKELTSAWSGDRTKVDEMTAAGQLICLGMGTSRRYPTWQLDQDPKLNYPVLPVAAELITIFRDELGADDIGETMVSWAATPQPELQGREPRDVITDPEQAERLLLSARRTAYNLAH